MELPEKVSEYISRKKIAQRLVGAAVVASLAAGAVFMDRTIDVSARIGGDGGGVPALIDPCYTIVWNIDEIGNYTGLPVWRVEPDDDILYATGHNPNNGNINEFRVFDIAQPDNIQLLSSIDLPSYSEDIEVAGDTVLVAEGNAGLISIDVSDPYNPVQADIISGAGWDAKQISIEEGYAHLASGNGSINIIDTSDPYNLSVVGYFDTTRYVGAVDHSYPYDYIAALPIFEVIDVTDRANPVYEGGYYLGPFGDVYNILVNSIDNNIVWALNYSGHNSLWVMDVSNPSSPFPVYEQVLTNTEGLPVDLEQLGEYLIILRGMSLTLYDVSGQPPYPEVGYYKTTDGSSGFMDIEVDQNRGLIYASVLSSEDGGIKVFSFSGEGATPEPQPGCTPTPTVTATETATETMTPTFTATWTVTPTRTATRTATPSRTPTETATATPSRTPTPTPTATDTVIPPTETSTATITPEPTWTATSTSTWEPEPTWTTTWTSTFEPPPTETSTVTPSPSPSSTPTDEPDWYVVYLPIVKK
jgi:hypothetical protein